MKTCIIALFLAIIMNVVAASPAAIQHYTVELDLCDGCSCNGCTSCVPIKFVNGRQAERCLPKRLAKRGLDIGKFQCNCDYEQTENDVVATNNNSSLVESMLL